MAGRRFIGVEDGGNAVELVFDDPGLIGGNLISIYTRGKLKGAIIRGFVARGFIDAGYGSGDGRCNCGGDYSSSVAVTSAPDDEEPRRGLLATWHATEEEE